MLKYRCFYLHFQPGVGVHGFAHDDVIGFGIDLHLFGRTGHVGLVTVHHAVDQVRDVMTLPLGKGRELLVARIGYRLQPYGLFERNSIFPDKIANDIVLATPWEYI